MDKIEIYWNGFEPLVRILIVGTLAYISIVLVLRMSGKRTLAKMNAFDFVITVTIGAVFGRVLTAKNVAISEAVTAFVLLAFLQFIFSYVETRSSSFRKIFTARPKMIYYKDSFIEKNLRKERLVKSDVLGSIRKKGIGSLEEVEAIILEADGTISVIEKASNRRNTTYDDLLEKK
ncbi:DUF421 domain-containing protein [Antarcticibacterium sp. 1MA-6-2]|uniref:DUF421 domain-containing protein n=1 Tax=Antarcticibacterium sp. 1MA-6-2 TaxID=2908210 RepID=UPI001F39CC4F|nr:YetF domain-containing protein [Antarcticibacterium sp. 1MA-6-2]UJH90473.1 DUF421 domain-containing protein [Antarcticibacterium sp. 1MA-6-2]